VNITVCICTYNRAASLREALASLEHAAASFDAGWALLVIDNNSSDETREVCADAAQRLPLRYVFEPEQGLSSARNRALREVGGGLLIFTDDDVLFDSGWLCAYAAAFKQWPGAAYFGGRILPRWPGRRPHWLRDESLPLISGLLVRYALGERDRPYRSDEPTPFGASFALNRDLKLVSGEFRCDLGVNGGIPGRGEETDYLERIIQAGGVGIYVGSALALHVQDASRFRWRYLYRYGLQKGVAARRADPKARSGRLATELLFAVRGLLQLLRGRGDRCRQCVILMGVERGLRRGNP